ncbi:MAG: DUF192 domain-containing protein [Candidatus Caldarchaeum sp.]
MRKSTLTFLVLFSLLLGAVLFQASLKTGNDSAASQSATLTSYENTQTSISYVEVGRFRVYVEVAEDDVEKARGLSGRESLPPDWGMLFIFDRPGMYSFWMYEMRFPIDIIWINETFHIVFMVENAPPCLPSDVCVPYAPNAQAKYVLEINAGLVERYGIKVGDRVVFSSGLAD